MGRIRTAFHKLAFLPNGEFSISRILMVAAVLQGFTVLWVGVVAYLVWQYELPATLYTYAGAVFGGGGVQYGFTKHMMDKRESRSGDCGSTPQEPEWPTPPGAV